MTAPQTGGLSAEVRDAVPADLRALPQWVLWKRVPDPAREKPRKIPVSPRSLANASSTDPKSWGDFEDVLALYDPEEFAGIGFVFSKTDPYCGIDLDQCVAKDGEELSEYAQWLVGQLASYTELSPSGSGIHIIVKAKLPGRGRKLEQIEIYDQARYFTVPGRILGQQFATVADRQDEVSRLYERLRPKKAPAFQSANRGLQGPELPDDAVLNSIQATGFKRKFSALFDGHWEITHGSRSEADLALVGILANFVGNNPAQIDRLFRRSKLYRPKWDEYRGAQTYGELTINKALGAQS